MKNDEDGTRIDRVVGRDGRREVERDGSSIRHTNQTTRVVAVVVAKVSEGAKDGSGVATASWSAPSGKEEQKRTHLASQGVGVYQAFRPTSEIGRAHV